MTANYIWWAFGASGVRWKPRKRETCRIISNITPDIGCRLGNIRAAWGKLSDPLVISLDFTSQRQWWVISMWIYMYMCVCIAYRRKGERTGYMGGRRKPLVFSCWWGNCKNTTSFGPCSRTTQCEGQLWLFSFQKWWKRQESCVAKWL